MSVLWPQQAPLLRKALELLDQLQDTLQQSAATTRKFHATLKVHLELVHDLEHAEATRENFLKADPALGLFTTEPHRQSFPEPSGSFTMPLAKTLATITPTGVLNTGSFVPTTKLAPVDEPSVTVVPEPTPLQPIGVLHDAVADSITAGCVALSTPRRTLTMSPLPLATTTRSPTAMFQFWCSLEFWIPIAVFKHRWRCKLVVANNDAPKYRELHRRFIMYACAASETEGHDPDKRPHRAACRATTLPFHRDVVTRLELMPFLGGTRFASFSGASGRSQLNHLERGSWTILGVHVAGAGADDILDDFSLREAVLSKCMPVPMEWALQLIGLMFGCCMGQL
jgi:hypothetical protein